MERGFRNIVLVINSSIISQTPTMFHNHLALCTYEQANLLTLAVHKCTIEIWSWLLEKKNLHFSSWTVWGSYPTESWDRHHALCPAISPVVSTVSEPDKCLLNKCLLSWTEFIWGLWRKIQWLHPNSPRIYFSCYLSPVMGKTYNSCLGVPQA